MLVSAGVKRDGVLEIWAVEKWLCGDVISRRAKSSLPPTSKSRHYLLATQLFASSIFPFTLLTIAHPTASTGAFLRYTCVVCNASHT